MIERAQTAEKPKAYECQFDVDSWLRISQMAGTIAPEKYTQILLSWQREVLLGLETNLGERFNAQLFEHLYPLENGRMMHPFQDKPFLDSIVEGQQYRLSQNTHLNHNQQRELAEVVSFSQVESYFAQKTRSRETLIAPSPPGGNYGHNFIDTFDLKNENGQNFVRLRRFAVSAPLEKHWDIAQKLTGNTMDPNEFGQPRDVILKKAVIRTPKTIEKILALYHPDQLAMSLEDYEKLKEIYRPFANAYVEAVMEGKCAAELELLLNASLKFADIQTGNDTDNTGRIIKTSAPKLEEIPFVYRVLENQGLRQVNTGCGIQGSINGKSTDLISSSLFKLSPLDSSLNEDKYGTLEIHCEECGTTYNRTPGKLEEKCRRCGGSKGITC